MSKKIKLNGSQIEKLTDKIKKELAKTNLFDGRLDFSYSFDDEEERTTNLVFTPKAYNKMLLLVNSFDTEVAWHGTVERIDNGFLITDIVVYPQEVSGATVNTDQWEYEKWLMDLEDDVFNNLRFQGHSHVNMGTSPSGVDVSHQEKIVEKLKGEDFYIFAIWNKKNDHYVKIFDLKENVIYEKSDITVYVQGDEIDYGTFLEQSIDMVKTKTYSFTTKKDDEQEFESFDKYKVYHHQYEDDDDIIDEYIWN